MRVPDPFTKEFRSDALKLIERGDRSIAQIARDLGINHWTLRNWCKSDPVLRKAKAAAATPPANESTEQRVARLERENERLRKENESLRTDREILKKAAAFFAKESD
jgi:transposase